MVITFRTAMTLRSCRYTYVIVVKGRSNTILYHNDAATSNKKGPSTFYSCFYPNRSHLHFIPELNFLCLRFKLIMQRLCVYHFVSYVCIKLYLRRRRSWNGFIAFTEKNDNYRMKHTRVLKTCHIWTRSSDIDSVDIILIMLLSVLSTLFTHWLGINIALISKRSKTNHDVVI